MVTRAVGVVGLWFAGARRWGSWQRCGQFIRMVVDDAPDQGVIS